MFYSEGYLRPPARVPDRWARKRHYQDSWPKMQMYINQKVPLGRGAGKNPKKVWSFTNITSWTSHFSCRGFPYNQRNTLPAFLGPQLSANSDNQSHPQLLLIPLKYQRNCWFYSSLRHTIKSESFSMKVFTRRDVKMESSLCRVDIGQIFCWLSLRAPLVVRSRVIRGNKLLRRPLKQPSSPITNITVKVCGHLKNWKPSFYFSVVFLWSYPAPRIAFFVRWLIDRS